MLKIHENELHNIAIYAYLDNMRLAINVPYYYGELLSALDNFLLQNDFMPLSSLMDT